MTASKRRIIRRMLDLWRTFWFLRFVRKKVKIDKHFAMKDFLWQRWIDQKRRWLFWRFDSDQTNEIINYAVDEGYLKPHNTINNGLELSITPRGKKLISFPVGTLEVFGKELGTGASLLISGVLVVWAKWHTVAHLVGRIIKRI